MSSIVLRNLVGVKARCQPGLDPVEQALEVELVREAIMPLHSGGTSRSCDRTSRLPTRCPWRCRRPPRPSRQRVSPVHPKGPRRPQIAEALRERRGLPAAALPEQRVSCRIRAPQRADVPSRLRLLAPHTFEVLRMAPSERQERSATVLIHRMEKKICGFQGMSRRSRRSWKIRKNICSLST